jgi:formate dehydrogenase subunit gamma
MKPEQTAPDRFHRFSRAERMAHRAIAVLTLSCLLTAVILYNGSIEILVGHRRAIELVHVYCGFALPVPVLVALVSAAFRADLRRLNRFAPTDWQWLRSRQRRDGSIRVGKFNAGQKLNACLSAGAVLVLLGSGVIMNFPDLARLSWRTGATFVHDWFALGFGLLILGHLTKAIKDAEARRGMRTGTVSSAWARTEHAAWAEEISTPDDTPHDASLT